jgi:nucleoside 2-deoxyribosyltransferase
MSGLKNFGAGWRKNVRTFLEKVGHSGYDPCLEERHEHIKYNIAKDQISNWEALPQELQEEIIEKDLDAINESDALICYFTRYSTGTISELTYALYQNLPVYFVTRKKLIGWVGTVSRAYPNKKFKTFKELKHFLRRQNANTKEIGRN